MSQIKLTSFPNNYNPIEKYQWFKENEQALSKIFNEAFIKNFQEYMKNFPDIKDIPYERKPNEAAGIFLYSNTDN